MDRNMKTTIHVSTYPVVAQRDLRIRPFDRERTEWTVTFSGSTATTVLAKNQSTISVRAPYQRKRKRKQKCARSILS